MRGSGAGGGYGPVLLPKGRGFRGELGVLPLRNRVPSRGVLHQESDLDRLSPSVAFHHLFH